MYCDEFNCTTDRRSRSLNINAGFLIGWKAQATIEKLCRRGRILLHYGGPQPPECVSQIVSVRVVCASA